MSITAGVQMTDFTGGLVGKESTRNAGVPGVTGLIPRSGRHPGGGHGNPLQYPCLENPMDRGAWQATVHAGHKDSDMTEASEHTHKHSDDTALMAESKDELESLYMKVKEESEKTDLKLNI